MEMVKQPFSNSRFGLIQLKQPFKNGMFLDNQEVTEQLVAESGFAGLFLDCFAVRCVVSSEVGFAGREDSDSGFLEIPPGKLTELEPENTWRIIPGLVSG